MAGKTVFLCIKFLNLKKFLRTQDIAWNINLKGCLSISNVKGEILRNPSASARKTWCLTSVNKATCI